MKTWNQLRRARDLRIVSEFRRHRSATRIVTATGLTPSMIYRVLRNAGIKRVMKG